MGKNKTLALGKGAAALFGNFAEEGNTPETNQVVVEKAKAKIDAEIESEKEERLEGVPSLIEIKDIKPNPNQPRKIFKEKELEELSQSISENGVIQPLIVSKIDDGFELIAGERRLKASIKAGLEKVPVIIKRATDREKIIMSIIENVQRSDLNCIEEALAYYQLMDEYNLTQDEVAKKLGKDRSTIANHLRILKLPRPVIELIQKDLLTFGHAKIIASIKERESAIKLASTAALERLSVRELEALVKKAGRKSKGQIKKKKSLNEKFDHLRQSLEKETGFHFQINPKRNGSGNISIKFNNEAELDGIYQYLLKRGN